MDWINPSGPDESGGIFTSGQYNWAVYDTAGDGLDGGSDITFKPEAQVAHGPQFNQLLDG